MKVFAQAQWRRPSGRNTRRPQVVDSAPQVRGGPQFSAYQTSGPQDPDVRSTDAFSWTDDPRRGQGKKIGLSRCSRKGTSLLSPFPVSALSTCSEVSMTLQRSTCQCSRPADLADYSDEAPPRRTTAERLGLRRSHAAAPAT